MKCKKRGRMFLCIFVILILSAALANAVEVDNGYYSASVFPDSNASQWEKISSGLSESVTINKDDPQLGSIDALYIDTLQDIANIVVFKRDITALTTDKITIEAKMRFEQGYTNMNLEDCGIWVGNGVYREVLLIRSGGIYLYSEKYLGHIPVSYYMDTTDDYHIYKVVTQNESIKVYVDNDPIPAIESTFWGDWYPTPSSAIMFGSSSSGASSKSSWAYFNYVIER